jgi:hypothetical protein
VIINFDPHVHTDYSSDGTVSIDKLVSISRRKGLNGVAITDHNSIEGALRLKDNTSDDFLIIVGEEIKTSEGEITGLFLKESIPSGLTPENTLDRIKSQGGLVCITHPFCRFRRSRLKFETLIRITERVDIIEVFNSRNILDSDNEKAFKFAKDHNKLMVAGSDAHIAYEYGRSYLRIFPFDNGEEFKKNLATAKIVAQKTPLWVHFVTKWTKIKNNLDRFSV